MAIWTAIGKALMPPLRRAGGWLYKTVVHRMKFESRPINPHIFRNPSSGELFASIQIDIENHNDQPLLISSVELLYGDNVLKPTGTVYAYDNVIAPLMSTPFPYRVEAHTHTVPRVIFEMNQPDVPECTLIIRVGKYERSYDLSLSYQEV